MILYYSIRASKSRTQLKRRPLTLPRATAWTFESLAPRPHLHGDQVHTDGHVAGRRREGRL